MKSTKENAFSIWLATDIGRTTKRWVNDAGAATIFLIKALTLMFKPKQLSLVIHQTYYIGAQSVWIVMMVGLFTGMVMGLQLYYTLEKFGSAGALGSAVALSLIRELGPVLTAIMVAARAGSSMTTEIGIQRITDQIDALFTMRIDPLQHLISPRIAASIISIPLLTVYFDIIGIIGGFISGVMLLDLDPGTYFDRVQSVVKMQDITGGVVKSVVFAGIISTTCCFHGYFSHMRSDSHGARAVGQSTTSGVVVSCVLVLVADYVVTAFFL